jgi:hypothetical protein
LKFSAFTGAVALPGRNMLTACRAGTAALCWKTGAAGKLAAQTRWAARVRVRTLQHAGGISHLRTVATNCAQARAASAPDHVISGTHLELVLKKGRFSPAPHKAAYHAAFLQRKTLSILRGLLVLILGTELGWVLQVWNESFSILKFPFSGESVLKQCPQVHLHTTEDLRLSGLPTKPVRHIF